MYKYLLLTKIPSSHTEGHLQHTIESNNYAKMRQYTDKENFGENEFDEGFLGMAKHSDALRKASPCHSKMVYRHNFDYDLDTDDE